MYVFKRNFDENPRRKTGVIKVVAKLENGNESTYDEVEYFVKGKVKKAQKMPTLLKKHDKGEVILPPLFLLGRLLGGALDKLIINLIEKE